MDKPYQAPEVRSFGSLKQLTGILGPSTVEDVDERTSEEGTGSFSVTET